jgi:arylsulfatase A-like enzyme
VPTILDYAGVQIPRFVQGRSLRGLFSKEGPPPELQESALIELFFPFGRRETAIRTSRFLYYLSSTGKEILYDVESDPAMLHNAASADAYQADLSGLRKEMLRKLFAAGMNTADRPAEY